MLIGFHRFESRMGTHSNARRSQHYADPNGKGLSLEIAELYSKKEPNFDQRVSLHETREGEGTCKEGEQKDIF